MVSSNCCGPAGSSLMEEKEFDIDLRLDDNAGLFERDCQLEKVPLVREGSALEEPERWNIWDVKDSGFALEELAEGVCAALAEGELSGFVAAGVGRKASNEARMRRFVVPDVFVVPDRAEHTSTTRLWLSMADLRRRFSACCAE